ncbi:hypothetical protein NPS53_08030 [Pseudomonas putida]|uniref:hypothetical protein n=1 Tax=Pseudomonas putida TaxID=303 RepID=UPI002363A385|nr:hypothetical protein [Pseudomonas putida]MDD2139518.1 hypothetical protein [Pseudomonas putida]HDS1721846.1 hypothetical protein [Pseudomonas putida]
MSRHKILLPTSNPAIGGEVPTGNLRVECGFDRHPFKHIFCNIFEERNEDEPLWASVLEDGYDRVTKADGFDAKLSDFGIILPKALKDALADDWENENMKRDVVWSRVAGSEAWGI